MLGFLIAIFPGIQFGLEHRAEILPARCHHEHKSDGQQGIETVRNGGKEQQIGLFMQIRQTGNGFADQAYLVSDPGGDQGQAGHGCCG